jgi:hypothetical protein
MEISAAGKKSLGKKRTDFFKKPLQYNTWCDILPIDTICSALPKNGGYTVYSALFVW